MERSRTFKIAFGGICLALAVICMFGGSFIPGIDLTLFAVSSLFTAIMVIETGVGGGLLLFAGASILGLVLIPNKFAILPYLCFFGYYAVLKLYIEKISAPAGQIACKCAFFALVLCVGLLGFRAVLAQAVALPEYPSAVLIIAGVVLLLLYDFILSFLISFYYRRFKRVGPDTLKLS